jgi:uncharacterized protein (TIGR00297 family)
MLKFVIGFAAAVLVSFLAYKMRSLNTAGAVAAAVLGTIVFGLAGTAWAVVLLTFFISSSLLSKLFRVKKRDLDANFAKGSRRDASQVLANGGVAGLMALAYFLLTISTLDVSQNLLHFIWLGFAASLAAANADTWATELGVFNPRQPVFLSTFRRVPKGTSGAVSLVGSLAALSGAVLVALLAILCMIVGRAPAGAGALWLDFALISAAGLMGAFVDSLLGATFQAVFFCRVCEKETERHPTHRCGSPTTLVRGKPWLDNDGVNLACTFSAALLIFLTFLII